MAKMKTAREYLESKRKAESFAEEVAIGESAMKAVANPGTAAVVISDNKTEEDIRRFNASSVGCALRALLRNAGFEIVRKPVQARSAKRLP
jgi:hypothetical protein